jgi:hypothetical protein
MAGSLEVHFEVELSQRLDASETVAKVALVEQPIFVQIIDVLGTMLGPRRLAIPLAVPIWDEVAENDSSRILLEFRERAPRENHQRVGVISSAA